MKEKLHRLFSCLMALMLLVSTTSWTVGKHYCMGLLVDVSLFEHAEGCGMDMTGGEDENLVLAEQDERSCCNDEIITVEGQDLLKISVNDISFDQQLFLVAFSHSFLNLVQTIAERDVPDEHYPPPLLVKDIQLLDEVFII